jgi:hypothetical protein
MRAHRRRPPAIAREAIAILAANGRAGDIDWEGAHLKIRWVADGRKHMLVVSRSPSSRSAGVKSRATLLRMLREEGPSP